MQISMSLDKYRTQLINHILFASSQVEVNQFIEAAIKTLQQNNVNADLIARFVDKVIHDLELIDPINKDPQQWSNIKMARILFNRVNYTRNLYAC
jgi:hypothetical protein